MFRVRLPVTTLVTLAALIPPPGGFPPSKAAPTLPELTAESWILYDATNSVVLAAKDPDTRRAMASVTKIMTALVVRENIDLDARAHISRRAAGIGESEIGLAPGEVWNAEDLLEALLVRSGNDAAIALAELVSGSVADFVDLMNAKASDLGLTNSHFTNPHGLDHPQHYSSAADLLSLARHALEDPVLARIVRTRVLHFKPHPAGTPRIAKNTNKLLGIFPGAIGIKTGFTGRAGLVLISALERNGRVLIGVVMGSADHFADSRELLEYGVQSLTISDRLLATIKPAESRIGMTVLAPPVTPARAEIAPGLFLYNRRNTRVKFGDTERVPHLVARLPRYAPLPAEQLSE